jgi:hypothetical protein
MNSVTLDELKKVPYLNTDALAGRVVNLMPFWDGERWHQWVDTPSGLVEIKIIDAVEADYLAISPANPSDVLIPFVEFMWQRASFSEICPFIRGISEDFHNMGTSIAKLRYFFRSRDSLRSVEVTRFAATEVEYLVVLCRAVFDLLQEAVATTWQQHICLTNLDAEKQRRAHKLPDTFSKMVLRNKKECMTIEEIERRFGIPPPVAKAYFEHAPFFSSLRNMRDDIIHGGSGMGVVFVTEKGFCVQREAKPYSLYRSWTREHDYGNNLVSILPWIANIIVQTIEACNAIIFALASVVLFPSEIAPGLHVFVRGPSTEPLSDILQIYHGGSPWWNEVQDKEKANNLAEPNG